MDSRQREERKQRLKARLRSLPQEERKTLLDRLKARRADKAAREEEKPSEATPISSTVSESLTDEQIIESLFDPGRTKADQQRLIRGLSLLDIWRGLRALAALVVPMSKQVNHLYKNGVRRVASTSDAPNELAPINARKLHVFVKSVPGLWEKWDCEEALCWQCPWHNGKGVPNQNLECAEEATKIAMRRNRRIDLAEGIPYKKAELDKLQRRNLVALTKLVGKNAFQLKDSSKVGLVRVIIANQRKFKGLAEGERGRVNIMDLTGKEVSGEVEDADV
jgi:hypothetical protein